MAQEPSDPFADVDPVAPRPTQPLPRVTPLPAPLPPAPHRSARWPLLVGGAGVLLIGIATVVVLLRRSPALVTNTNVNSAGGAVVNVATSNTSAEPAAVQPDLVTNDRDRDGLTDEEEQKLGTKEAAADTDSDGLSDFDEVRVYKTNPKVPDTDGDGNADGVEVKKGYNPSGAGMLLDFRAARQKLTT